MDAGCRQQAKACQAARSHHPRQEYEQLEKGVSAMMISLDNVPLATQSAMLQNILLAFEHETFSKELAAHIVGGPAKLASLIASEKIQA